MNIELIRSEMLKCAKGCSAGIIVAENVHLMWQVGSHRHCEVIKKEQCVIGSREFKMAVNEAKVALVN